MIDLRQTNPVYTAKSCFSTFYVYDDASDVEGERIIALNPGFLDGAYSVFYTGSEEGLVKVDPSNRPIKPLDYLYIKYSDNSLSLYLVTFDPSKAVGSQYCLVLVDVGGAVVSTVGNPGVSDPTKYKVFATGIENVTFGQTDVEATITGAKSGDIVLCSIRAVFSPNLTRTSCWGYVKALNIVGFRFSAVTSSLTLNYVILRQV